MNIVIVKVKKPEENNVPVVKASISDKKVSTKMEPTKDFGYANNLMTTYH
jgi:hypothetical protein